MIIKSMARKSASFNQLIDYFGYFNKRESVFGLTHNLYAHREDAAAIVQEFESNHRHLKKRKNGNALYHEIIALDPDSRGTRKEKIAALRDLAQGYLQRRAPRQLAYGVIHTDTPYLHMHIVISSNEAGGSKRMRLPRREFNDIQRSIESYKLEKYPALGQEKYYNQERSSKRQTNRAQEMARHNRPATHKQQLHETLKRIFAEAQSPEQLKKYLHNIDLTLYARGRSVGVQTDGGRRYRLATLGLMPFYLQMQASHDLLAARMQELNDAAKHLRREQERER